MDNILKRSSDIIKKEGINSFAKKIFVNSKLFIKTKTPSILGFISVSLSKKLTLRGIDKFYSENPEEVFSYINNYFFGLFAPMQVKEEFLELLKIVNTSKPKVIVEIGTANGGTLFCLSRLASDYAKIISLDLPGGRFGGGYETWRMPFFNKFKRNNQRLYLLREDSHTLESLEKLKTILSNDQIDFLFIDGDHRYDGVKKDFEMYAPLVRKNGIIAFHDIAPNGIESKAGGVPKFWKEIKNNYTHKEFIKDQNQIAYGIGCVFL